MKNHLINFELLQKLGQGAYSTVYKARRKVDGQIYALKLVKLLDIGEREKQNTLNEIRFISSIKHKNIIGYKECFIDESSQQLCLVMEYAQQGDLYQKIKKQIQLQLYISENEIWKILIQIILALKVLHDQRIYHRDLKCANIFLFENNIVKLGDFNVSKLVKQGFTKTQTGTPYYASPEVWSDKPYDHKTDIWSLGCVLYETCCLKPPFRGKDMTQLYKSVQKGLYKPIPEIYSPDLSKIIKFMLNVNPISRPDCDKLLSLPYIVRQMQMLDLNNENHVNLMKTIKWPKSSSKQKSFVQISPLLPKSNYQSINQLNSNHLRKKNFNAYTRKPSTDDHNLNETMKKLVDEIERLNQKEKKKLQNQRSYFDEDIVQEKYYSIKPIQRKPQKLLSEPGENDSKIIKREQNYSQQSVDIYEKGRKGRIRNSNSDYVRNLNQAQSVEPRLNQLLPKLKEVDDENYQLIKRPQKKIVQENNNEQLSVNLGNDNFVDLLNQKEILSVSQLKANKSVEKGNKKSLPKLKRNMI